MIIQTVRHKGLRRFMEMDDSVGLPAAVVPKIREILSFLQNMQTEAELRALAFWNRIR